MLIMMVILGVLIDRMATAETTGSLCRGANLRTVVRSERPLSAGIWIDQRRKKSLRGMREPKCKPLYMMAYPLKSSNSGGPGQARRAESERCRRE